MNPYYPGIRIPLRNGRLPGPYDPAWMQAASRASMSLRTPPGLPSVPAGPGPLHIGGLTPTFARLNPNQITDLRKNVQMWKWLRQNRRLPMDVMHNRQRTALLNSYWKNMDAALRNWPQSPFGIPLNLHYQEPVLPLPPGLRR